MRYKYYYCLPTNSQLIELLESNHICYKTSGGKSTPLFTIFSLWSSDKNTSALVESLANICHQDPIVTPEFSKAELEKAKLLVIRPKKQIIKIINGKEAFSHSCTWNAFGITRVNHEWQIGTLAIAKEPSITTNTALWASDSGFAEIFADSRVYDLAASNNLSGINFEKVLLKNGQYSNNIYQMTSKHLIQKEMIAVGHGEKIQKCPICGKEQFSINSAYQLYLNNSEALVDCDFYTTDRIFGDGIAEPLFIISQRLYQLLKQNNLAKNVVFTPVAGA